MFYIYFDFAVNQEQQSVKIYIASNQLFKSFL